MKPATLLLLFLTAGCASQAAVRNAPSALYRCEIRHEGPTGTLWAFWAIGPGASRDIFVGWNGATDWSAVEAGRTGLGIGWRTPDPALPWRDAEVTLAIYGKHGDTGMRWGALWQGVLPLDRARAVEVGRNGVGGEGTDLKISWSRLRELTAHGQHLTLGAIFADGRIDYSGPITAEQIAAPLRAIRSVRREIAAMMADYPNRCSIDRGDDGVID